MQVRIEWGGRVSLPGSEGKVWKAWGKAGGHRHTGKKGTTGVSRAESTRLDVTARSVFNLQPQVQGTRPYVHSEFWQRTSVLFCTGTFEI